METQCEIRCSEEPGQTSAKQRQIRGEYIELENMASSAVKGAFSTKPSRVYKYDKILALAMWHFDGKILNVNTEDLHNDAKGLHRPEDYCTGKAKIYSRPCRHDQ